MPNNKSEDAYMRQFENASDYCVPPEIYMVARLDGKCFSRLTRTLDKPFDVSFRDAMTTTTHHLMNACDFNILYGYHQSDEISLCFSLKENSFNRKLRKLNSVLAGEASAMFTTVFNKFGVFDCRISQLPNIDLVYRYFKWRLSDALRNALHSYAYWMYRNQGESASSATAKLQNKTAAAKQILLGLNGINFNTVPEWTKQGVGLYWEAYKHTGFDPILNVPVIADRKMLTKIHDLPRGEGYSKFLQQVLKET